ncbi:hypothetical protein EJ110_NYTH49602 [Nymphaea thermarum]|nr:hypothetical protein EJ110_NYTH49602 [Nymphaea thermarum]
MVGNNVQQELPKLGDLEIREENGSKFLFIPDEMYEEMTKPFRFAAIGTFYGGCSKANIEYSFVFKSLRHQQKEVHNPRFSVLGKGLYLIRVDSEAELLTILRRNYWRIGAKTFVASRWRPGMEMKVDHTTRIPIWIQIPNLASELWDQSDFEGIARTLGGEVLSIDPFTRSLVRMDYARMCIEVPFCFSPQPKIFLRGTNGDFIRVEIVYENMIRFCRNCGSLSHLDSNCAQSRVSLVQGVEKKSDDSDQSGWTKVRMARKSSKPKRPSAGGLQASSGRRGYPLPVGATQARAHHGRHTAERQPPWWPITVWIHFIRCSGRALIHGCVNSKERYSTFPRTPRLGRREPTLHAQHTTVPWGLAPPALRTGKTSGKNKEGTANKPQSSDSTASRGAHENKWGTSVKSERPLTPEWSHRGLAYSA